MTRGIACVRKSIHNNAYAQVLNFMKTMDSESDDLYRRKKLFCYIALLYRRRSKRRRTRNVWVRSIFCKRQEQGEYANLLQEMRLSDPQCHSNYLRMSKTRFDIVLSHVGPLLTRRLYFSRQRAEIRPAERLAVTLRYLVTGNSQLSMFFNFLVISLKLFGTSQIALVLSMGNMWLFRHPPIQGLLSLITKKVTRSS